MALLTGEGWASADHGAALVAWALIADNGVRLFWGAVMEILDLAPPVQRVRAARILLV